MNLKNFVLVSASVGIGLIGVGYLVSPDFMYGLYGIEITSVNEFSMVRGAYGGLFVTFSILFLLGAIYPGLFVSSLVGLFTFMFGFALGRLSALLIEGEPSLIILGLILFEIIYSILSGYLLFGDRSKLFSKEIST